MPPRFDFETGHGAKPRKDAVSEAETGIPDKNSKNCPREG
jgi:hypothetical protein